MRDEGSNDRLEPLTRLLARTRAAPESYSRTSPPPPVQLPLQRMLSLRRSFPLLIHLRHLSRPTHLTSLPRLNTSTTTRTMASLPSISLLPNEQQLCDLLVGAADWIQQHPEEVDALRLRDDEGNWVGRERGKESVELRIAGGWVRDKVRFLSLFFPSVLELGVPDEPAAEGRVSHPAAKTLSSATSSVKPN